MHINGTIVNTITVIVGSAIGLLVGERLPERFKKIIIQAIALFTFLIGASMMLKADNLIIIFLSLIAGGITGEALKLEEHLNNITERLKKHISPDSKSFTEGFITATLIFCVGAMTVVGSIQEGLTGDATLLYTKSLMDGITSLTLASGLGIGVMLSAVSVFLIQGSLTLLGTSLKFLMSGPYLNAITASGGLLIIALGLDLLQIKKLKVLNLLPALIYAPLFVYIASFF